MVKLLGGRAASAVVGILMLAVGSSATAQDMTRLNVSAAVKALDVDASSKPLGTATSVASTLARPAVASTTAGPVGNANVFQAQAARCVTLQLTPTLAH